MHGVETDIFIVASSEALCPLSGFLPVLLRGKIDCNFLSCVCVCVCECCAFLFAGVEAMSRGQNQA